MGSISLRLDKCALDEKLALLTVNALLTSVMVSGKKSRLGAAKFYSHKKKRLATVFISCADRLSADAGLSQRSEGASSQSSDSVSSEFYSKTCEKFKPMFKNLTGTKF